MSATSSEGRGKRRGLRGRLDRRYEMLEWAGDFPKRFEGDPGIERCCIELLMSERTRAIMLTFSVIETKRARCEGSDVSGCRRGFCSHYTARSSSLITAGA